APLQSRERRTVRVRAVSTDGRETPWSEEIVIEAGLLAPSDWSASFVGPVQQPATQDEPSPFVRGEFSIDGDVASARLYVSALGVYEAYLNGAVVGDEVLAPNFTSYNNRVRYQTYDVTEHVRPGRNALGAILADGWYRGRFFVPGGSLRNIFGSSIA